MKKKSIFASALAIGAPMAFTFPVSARAADAPAAGDTLVLDEVVIKSFVTHEASSALKLDVPVKDIPYSVENYSDSFMKAVETTNVSDLYGYMTGVQRGGSTGYDISIRGFKTIQSDKNAIMVDGLPGVPGRFGSPPTVGVDHIEVVKGPASVLYGQAQPGGFVNIISKKPKKTAAAVGEVTTSTYSGHGLSVGDRMAYDGNIDFTGPIDSVGNFLYRFIAEYADKDTFRNYAWEKATYVAPSLTWVISDATVLTVQGEYRKRDSSYDQNFLIAPAKNAALINPDIKTRYQEPDDEQSETGTSGSFLLTHNYDGGAKLNFAGRHVETKDHSSGFDIVSVLADNHTLTRRARQQANKRTYDFVDANFSIPFSTGFISHAMLVGVNGGVDTTDFNRVEFYQVTTTPRSPPTQDVYNVVYGLPLPVDAYPSAFNATTNPLNERYTRSTSYGAYWSDMLTFSEQWKATLGLRYAHEKQLGKELLTPPLTSVTKTGSKVLPTLGITYQPTKEWSLYASYATSYVPPNATDQDANGNNSFQSQLGKQIEAGVKTEMLDGRLTSTFAVFDIRKTNTLAPVTCIPPTAGTCSQQVGAERSKGAEFELNYSLLTNWQTLLGYAYTDAKIDSSNSSPTAPLVGARLTNSSVNNAHLWSRYDVTSGSWRGLGVGVGVIYNDNHTGSLPSLADGRVLLLPGYVTADLALYYSLHDRYNFTLKVSNITDKTYYEGVNSTTNELSVVPGAPRNITLSAGVPIY